MKLLLLSNYRDEPHLESFQRLPALQGHKVLNSSKPIDNTVALDAICQKHGIEGIFCTQWSTMEKLLSQTPDYIPHPRKKPSQDDYAGSLLYTKAGRPVVILQDLERLRTVSYEKFVVSRYIEKITAPSKFWKQTKFQWKKVHQDDASAIAKHLATADLISPDIETPWPPDELRSIDCVSFTGYWHKTRETVSYVIEFDELWKYNFIKTVCENPVPKVFQNGLFDNTYFLRWGICPRNWYYDTFHLFHCWLSELPKDLGFITSFLLRDVRFWKDEGSTGNQEDRLRYCALDSWGTVNAWLALMEIVPEWAIYNYTEHEFPLVFPCLHASLEGLLVDSERFEQIREKKEKECEVLLRQIQYLLATPNFNPNSSKQVSKLFMLLGCEDLVKDDSLSDRENSRRGTGKIPTQKAKYRHPLNSFLLTKIENYKQEFKQVTTYFNSEKIWNGTILYSINPGKTDTGRGASEASSFGCGWQIQNIPRDDLSFKECCLAPQGWYIGEIDKKQSEARCVGYLSGEQKLINLVESSHDYHAWNAAQFFGVKYELIFDESTGKTLMKPLRDLSKRTNHGANYNMGGEVLLDTMGPAKVAAAKIALKLPQHFSLRQVCEYLLDQYDKTYPGIRGRWYRSIIAAIETTRKLVSPLGWTRYFFGSPGKNKQHLNAAVAHAPQNLSVQIINKEWRKIWWHTVYGKLQGKVRIKAQIHDSLLFIYRSREDAEQVANLMDLRVKVTGADGVTRELYIPCDLSLGETPTRRWSELK
jgi:DNA polymerase I-like protein with 3'-5' exonuclease and polymerase domains